MEDSFALYHVLEIARGNYRGLRLARQTKCLKEAEVVSVTWAVASALLHLQNLGIVHRRDWGNILTTIVQYAKRD